MTSQAALPEIASLWIGEELSWLEQVCLQSFVDHGHRVVLFSYGPVEGVPAAVEFADARDLMPGEDIIRHARTGSPAYHADRFRLILMANTDFVWVDTDAYAHAPLVVPEHGHLHGLIGPRGSMTNNGVLRLPGDSATLAAMLDFTADEHPVPPWFSRTEQAELRARKDKGDAVHVSNLPWGVWGPNALTHFLRDSGEERFSQPQEVLYPVPFEYKGFFFRPQKREAVEAMITEATLSVHLWGRRFRRVAGGQGGMPAQGSYADAILRRHNVDPVPSLHLMLDVKTDDGQGVQFDALSEDDLINLVLQRSTLIRDPAIIAAWTGGDDRPLRAFVRRAQKAIPAQVWDELSGEFVHLKPRISAHPPARVADIGCGYAFLDLMLYRACGCEIVLIDIEDSNARHFGFEAEGAGYSSLEVARAFLIDNGVPEDKIVTLNPRTEDVTALGSFDLALSFLSCGFHYGAQTYEAFWQDQVRPGGAIALDIRKGSRGVGYMKRFGAVSVLSDEKKHAKILVERPDG